MAGPTVAWHDSLKNLVRGTNFSGGPTSDGGFFLEWEDFDTRNVLSIYFDENGSLEETTIELDGEVSHIHE